MLEEIYQAHNGYRTAAGFVERVVGDHTVSTSIEGALQAQDQAFSIFTDHLVGRIEHVMGDAKLDQKPEKIDQAIEQIRQAFEGAQGQQGQDGRTQHTEG